MAQRPSPRRLPELRGRSEDVPPINDYTPKNWLHSAQNSLEKGNRFVQEDRDSGGVNPILLEEAFISFKQVAIIFKHRLPGANAFKGQDLTLFNSVRSDLISAERTVKEILYTLEMREKLYDEKIISNGVAAASIENGNSLNYQRGSTNSSTKSIKVPPSPGLSTSPTPSVGGTSIQERLSALRGAGLETSGQVKSQPPTKPPKPDSLVPTKLYGQAFDSRQQSQATSPRLNSQEMDPPFASTSSYKYPRAPSPSNSVVPADSPSAASFPSLSRFEAGFISPSSELNGFSFPTTPTNDPRSEYQSHSTSPRSLPQNSNYPINGNAIDLRIGSNELPRKSFDIHPSLIAGRTAPPRPPRSPNPPTSTSPTPSSATFKSDLLLSSDISAEGLYQLLSQPGSRRILLLDLRSTEEFNEGRISGEVVSLDPLIMRDRVTSVAIESSLSVSPQSQQSLFASRNHYDLVIIYDRASNSIPTSIPHTATSSVSQQVLWNLFNAIYDQEFSKSLKRQPLLLKGGFESWQKQIGEQGIVRQGGFDHNGAHREVNRNGSDVEKMMADEFGRIEARKLSNRKASIGPSTAVGQAVIRTSIDESNYFSNPSNNLNLNYRQTSSIQSPRLAMPPLAVQRSDSRPSTEPYSNSNSNSFSRPSYPQPYIHGLQTEPNCMAGAGGGLSRYQSEFGNGQAPTQSFSGDYNLNHSTRTPIDYPRLPNPPPLPPLTQSTYAASPPVPTRPAAVQPAPVRSNSGLGNLSKAPYASASSAMQIRNSRFAGGNSSWSGIGGEERIGLTGLKNLGNTCYMNSTIQCLSATIPFARYFTDNSFYKDINQINPLGTKGKLAMAVSDLIRSMWQESYNFLSPVTFREQICLVASQFRGSDQHDAQEFLGFLLDGLHEDLNYVLHKPKIVEMTRERERDLEELPQQIMSVREWDLWRLRGDSFVAQGFQGQFRNMMKCFTCGQTSTTYNTFMPLSVPIPTGRGLSRVTIDDCIAAFVKEEILDKDDAWYCPRCKTHRRASKKLSISRLPPILVIHLKRFSFKGPFSDKLETQVQYPLSGLDLTSYVPPPLLDRHAPPLTSPPKGLVYDLYSVTNHYGNLSSGHYTAYIRNRHDWYNVGDSKYSKVDPSVVQSARSAYILYYRLR